MTSAVTSMPCALAQRITSTEPAVETWATCTRLLVCRASITSRATIVSSAMPGQPGQARGGRRARPRGSRPSARRGRGPASAGRRRRRTRGRTPAPGASPAGRARTCRRRRRPAPSRRERAIRPSSASSSPPRPRVTAPTGCTSTRPGGPTEVEHPLGRLGGVGDRGGVGHGQHGGEAAQGRGPRAGEHRLGVLAAGLAQVGVQVDEPGQRDQAVGVDHLAPFAGGASSTSTPSSTYRSAAVSPSGEAPLMTSQLRHWALPSPASRW